MTLNESDLHHVMLYGNKNFDNSMNISILTATIKFIKDSERFDQPLFKMLLKPFSFLHSCPFYLFIFFKKSIVLQLGFLP